MTDREDPRAAEAIVTRICLDAELRGFLLRRLLRSIAAAEDAGPRSWAVTLFDDGFRLNVGQVEVFTCFNRLVRVFMLGAPPAAAYTVGEVIPVSFRSMPQPQFGFYGGVRELQRLEHAIAGPHETFVRTAAVTAKGKPRKCSFARTHSPGLYNYAVAATATLKPSRSRRKS